MVLSVAMQQTCFMHTSHFITQDITKITLKAWHVMKWVIFTDPSGHSYVTLAVHDPRSWRMRPHVQFVPWLVLSPRFYTSSHCQCKCVHSEKDSLSIIVKIGLTSHVPKGLGRYTMSVQTTLCKPLLQRKPFRNISYIQINFSIHSEMKYFAK